MSRNSVRASALAAGVTLASLFGLAGPAMAQGGTPPPAPIYEVTEEFNQRTLAFLQKYAGQTTAAS